jgi:esterase/lipase
VGAPLADARADVIMLHGRGGTPDDILTLADLFAQSDLTYIAPQATGGSRNVHCRRKVVVSVAGVNSWATTMVRCVLIVVASLVAVYLLIVLVSVMAAYERMP